MKLFMAILLGGVAACSLSNGDDGPGDLPLSELRAAPTILTLGDQHLMLRTFMWRDFQPVAPRDGRPLISIFWIYSSDSTALPSTLTTDAAWVVNGELVWDTYFSDEEPPPSEQQPYQLYKVARDGPKWGPDIEVDAVVRIRDVGNQTHLLRAASQHIGRTD